ncbi:hypothetical protein K9M79_03410 [Candidatus Woesearchaeota archaeon]|nr:hypothetical protein [Candidatus Woesearchaeota archaeon]
MNNYKLLHLQYCICFILAVGLLFGCTNNTSDSDAIKDDINEQIHLGEKYLNGISDEHYFLLDDYLKYVYPGEDLLCPNGCYITYRILDAYFDVKILWDIENEFDNGSSDNRLKDISMKEMHHIADKNMNSIRNLWSKEAYFDNIAYVDVASEKAIGRTEGIALDTFCILGFLYNDSAMGDYSYSKVVLDPQDPSYLKWMSISKYDYGDQWRKLADEIWCIMLSSKTGHDVSGLIDKKEEEYKQFMMNDYGCLFDAAAALHMLMMYDTAETYSTELCNGCDWTQEIEDMQDQLVMLMGSESCNSNTLLLSNVITELIKTKYDNNTYIDESIEEIISRQTQCGAWYPTIIEDYKNDNCGYTENTDNGQAFTTLRALIALAYYKKYSI